MQRFWLIALVLTLSLSLVNTSALAQEDTQSFTSADGALMLEYPAGWTASTADGGYLFASLDGLALNDLPEDVPTSEMVLGIIPPELLSDLDMTSTEAPATVVGTVAGFFSENLSDTVEEEINGHSAVYVTASAENADYLILAIAYDEGTVIALGVTALDEIENALPTFLSIVQSMNYAAPEPVDTGNLAAITLDNASNLRELLDFTNENYDIRQVAASADGTLVAFNYASQFEDATSDYGLTVVDVASGEIALQMNSHWYNDMAFSADGSQILYTRGDYDEDNELIGQYEGSVDIATGESAESEISALATLYFDINGEVVQLLATIAEDGSSAHIVVADPETADITTEFDLNLENMGGIYDLNPDASALLVSTETSIHILDIASSELGEPLYTVEWAEFRSATFSPDGSLVAFTEYETNSVYIADVTSGEILVTVDRFDLGYALDFATFSPDGAILFVAQRGGLLVIDVASGEILAEMPQIVDGNLEDLAMSADGRVIIGGGYDAVMVWGVVGE